MNKNSANHASGTSTIARYVSFVMLCVTIVVCGFFFYSVIKGFLLPLFLACLLAVIFRPLHEWVSEKCGNRPAASAAITTSTIMLAVLVPLTGLVALGLYEANQLIRSQDEYIDKMAEVRRSMGLQKPFAEELDTIENKIRKLDEAMSRATTTDEAYLETLIVGTQAFIEEQVVRLKNEARDAVKELGSANGEVPDSLAPAVAELRRQLYADVGPGEFGPELRDKDRTAEKRSLRMMLERSGETSDTGFVELVNAFSAKVAAFPVSRVPTEGTIGIPTTVLEQRNALTEIQAEYEEVRTALFGGPLWKWAVELVNPSRDQIKEWISMLITGDATRWLPSITGTATSLITGLLVGLGIMSVALFYFFMDGPKMINAFMHLSPLDDRHELELLQEFDKVSRAVVLATLLSAVAQGILGGIGYKIVGMDSIFLLTLLTAVLALIPFVGAAAVWVPCCIYIAFVKETGDPEGVRTWMYAKAGFLAVYGALVISMADNVIKPWVLQGQSKLHPLLALLSVLGGVQALGPIGILVGPMVVAFLQVLLTILQREITSMDQALKSSS